MFKAWEDHGCYCVHIDSMHAPEENNRDLLLESPYTLVYGPERQREAKEFVQALEAQLSCYLKPTVIRDHQAKPISFSKGLQGFLGGVAVTILLAVLLMLSGFALLMPVSIIGPMMALSGAKEMMRAFQKKQDNQQKAPQPSEIDYLLSDPTLSYGSPPWLLEAPPT